MSNKDSATLPATCASKNLSEICFTVLKNINICQFIFANQVPLYTKLLIYIRLER